MLYYKPLYYGEGISGPADVGAGTGPLYSCIGVAFVNSGGRQGGLYHYPAHALNVRLVRDTIRQMIGEIQPDQVVVTPAAATGPGMGSRSDDFGNLVNFLQTLCPSVTIQQAEPGVSAQLVWSGGRPTFNQQPFNVSDYYDEDIEPDEDLRAMRSSQPRPLGNGAFYYGVNGENRSLGSVSSSVGAATGPSHAASFGRPRFRKGSRRKWIQDRCTVM